MQPGTSSRALNSFKVLVYAFAVLHHPIPTRSLSVAAGFLSSSGLEGVAGRTGTAGLVSSEAVVSGTSVSGTTVSGTVGSSGVAAVVSSVSASVVSSLPEVSVVSSSEVSYVSAAVVSSMDSS